MDVAMLPVKWQFVHYTWTICSLFQSKQNSTSITCERWKHCSETRARPLNSRSVDFSQKESMTWDKLCAQDLWWWFHTRRMPFVHCECPPTLRNCFLFFGLCSALRKFVPSYPRRAALANEKICEDKPENISPLIVKENKLMNALKKALIAPQYSHYVADPIIWPWAEMFVSSKSDVYLTTRRERNC